MTGPVLIDSKTGKPMNGTAPGQPAPEVGGLKTPALNPDQWECVKMLEKVLEDAKAGNVHSVAVVACSIGGFGSAFAGRQAPELNLGLDSVKRQILDNVTGQAPKGPKPSAILRPR